MSKFNINICPLCGSKLMNQTDYRYCKSCEIRFLVQKNQLTLTHDMMMEMCDRAFARFPSAESADTFSKLQKFDSTFFPAAFGMALVICKEDRSDEQINHYLEGTSKNRFEKGKWVECAECDESRRSKVVCLTRRFEEAVGALYTFSLKQGF